MTAPAPATETRLSPLHAEHARMDHGPRRSTAQLYALIIGAFLTIAGISGFFYNADFTSDKSVRDALFGFLDINGWSNTLHVVTGVIGLIAAGSWASARGYALSFGIVYVLVAIWGFIVGDGESVLSILPVNTADNVLHLLIGVSGIAAGMATSAVAEPTTTRPADA
jgi:hypothetical protein